MRTIRIYFINFCIKMIQPRFCIIAGYYIFKYESYFIKRDAADGNR